MGHILINPNILADIIGSLSQKLRAYYVLPETAAKLRENLQEHLKTEIAPTFSFWKHRQLHLIIKILTRKMAYASISLGKNDKNPCHYPGSNAHCLPADACRPR